MVVLVQNRKKAVNGAHEAAYYPFSHRCSEQLCLHYAQRVDTILSELDALPRDHLYHDHQDLRGPLPMVYPSWAAWDIYYIINPFDSLRRGNSRLQQAASFQGLVKESSNIRIPP
jgi:hypothetical protein